MGAIESLKSYSLALLKLSLLILGLADLIGMLPESLDLFDKILTSGILAFFWYKLGLSKFIFGKSKKWLDITILAAYYFLVIDTFVNIIRLINLDDVATTKISSLISVYIPSFLALRIKSSFLYLYDPLNSSAISLFSVYAGFSLIILISLYSAFRIEYGSKSVMHSIIRVFIKKEETWKNFADTKGYSINIKFLISLFVMFFISRYFFGLVNQWFIVSLDKTLIIMAVLFAVKDFKGTKSRMLNKIGDFDEWLLGTITEIFTNKNKFYLGFGILLIFHYLSDLATFFLPFFFRSLQIDPYYLDYLSDRDGSLHQPLSSLIGAEKIGSIYEMMTGTVLYNMSSIGVIFLILFPVILLYFIVKNIKLSNFLDKKRHIFLIIILFVAVISFQLAPWVMQKSIVNAGIQGVDFTTNTIFSQASISNVFIIVVILFLVSLFSFFSKKFSKYILTFLFFTSFIYLGEYVWKYFISSFFFHLGVINYFILSNNFYVAVVFIFVFILEILFYLGGFIMLTYNSAKILINDFIRDLITDRAIYLWTLILALLPIWFMYKGTIEAFTLTSIVIATLFIFSYAMYKVLIGEEKRDDYILAVNIALASYQVLLIISLVLQMLIGLSDQIMAFVQPVIIFLLAFLGVRFFKIKFTLKEFKAKQVVFVIVLAILFGLFFYFINEPKPVLFSNTIIVIAFYTLIVSLGEEVMFRLVLFRLAKMAFTSKTATHLQAVVFSLIHFVGLSFILEYYTIQNSYLFSNPYLNIFLYFIFLYAFSVFAANLVTVKNKTYNLSYAVILHWLVNFVTITLAVYI